MTSPLERWHDYMEHGDSQILSTLLADNVVFESPVVHTPQHGATITSRYLNAASHVLGGPGFHYVGEWHGENSAILEFEQELQGIQLNGIDMIWWNDQGRITHFKVMVRPLKAINLLHQLMGAQLQTQNFSAPSSTKQARV